MPATFFCLGRNVRDHGDLHRGSVGRHELANHTFDHPDLGRLRLVALPGRDRAHDPAHEEDVRSRSRPSSGRRTATSAGPPLLAAAEAGLTTVLWSAQAREDLVTGRPDGIVDDIASQVRPGSIVLAHDTGLGRPAHHHRPAARDHPPAPRRRLHLRHGLRPAGDQQGQRHDGEPHVGRPEGESLEAADPRRPAEARPNAAAAARVTAPTTRPGDRDTGWHGARPPQRLRRGQDGERLEDEDGQGRDDVPARLPVDRHEPDGGSREPRDDPEPDGSRSPRPAAPSRGRRSTAPAARSRPKTTNAAFISPCPGEHTSTTDPAWPGRAGQHPERADRVVAQGVCRRGTGRHEQLDEHVDRLHQPAPQPRRQSSHAPTVPGTRRRTRPTPRPVTQVTCGGRLRTGYPRVTSRYVRGHTALVRHSSRSTNDAAT